MVDTRPPKLQSSFLSCEKDTEIILKRLFVDYRMYSDILKRLLVINTKDCLDTNNKNYQRKIDSMSVKDLIDQGYIKLNPKLPMPEHEEVKAYIIISYDNFFPNATNPHFRDCTVSFDIICHTDYWDLGDYKQRPLKIAGFIDGLLDDARLTGIGTFQFAGGKELLLSSELSGYTIMFNAIHGVDDEIPTIER